MSGRLTGDDRGSDLYPGRIALGYCVVSLTWIFGSGYLVSALTSGATSTAVEIGKGVGFVLVTAGGLYVVLARRARSIRLAQLARAAADEERLRLATAVEQAAEAVLITDSHGQMTYVNPAFESLTGFSRAELLGSSPSILDAPGGKAGDWPATEGPEVWRGRLTHVRKDGTELEVDTVVSPVRGSDGSVLYHVAVERDVSHEAALERELAEAARMEAVGQLAGGIAHDFNNQLTAIMGNAEILRAELADNPSVAIDIEEILRASRSAAGMVKQLLALARRQVLEPTSLSLGDLIGSQLQPMLRGLLGPRTELEICCAPDAGRVWADAGQIEQVLVNLTVNARDAMPNGGKFVVTVSNVEIEAGQELAARIPPGQYVLLSAADSGVGMDEPTLARAFEPFFTTKAPGKGTGLGLSSTHGIISQSGGYLTVDSERGAGTIFRIYLPPHTGPKPAAVGRSSPAVAGGSETILLVEDEPAVQVIARQALERLGYRVLVSLEAAEALRLAESEGPFPLLVTDIRLPGLDGPSLAAELKKRNGHLRVLYVSGYAGDHMVSSGMVSSDEAFLAKPFTAEELARRVRALLDGTQS